LPAVTFTAHLLDLCIDAGIQSGLGSGIATGGVYSGTGGLMMEWNNLFLDPAALVLNTYTITYILEMLTIVRTLLR
jgi:hypothetical protein